MITLTRDGIDVIVPDFYEKEQPDLFRIEIDKQIALKKQFQSNNVRKSTFEQTLSTMQSFYT